MDGPLLWMSDVEIVDGEDWQSLKCQEEHETNPN